MRPAPGEAKRVTHRGIHWHQAPSGRIRWWNTEDKAWIIWRPGDDAPPRPDGWDARGGPATSRSARPSFRSPYRLVPIVIALIIVVYGVVQATQGSGGQTSAETKAADKLVGRCLVTNGTANGHPRYSATSVVCSDPRASVKVLRVLPGTPGARGCGAGTTGLSLPYPGVRYPHLECVVAAHPPVR